VVGVGGGVAEKERDEELAVEEARLSESLGGPCSWELRSSICWSVSIVAGSGGGEVEGRVMGLAGALALNFSSPCSMRYLVTYLSSSFQNKGLE